MLVIANEPSDEKTTRAPNKTCFKGRFLGFVGELSVVCSGSLSMTVVGAGRRVLELLECGILRTHHPEAI